MIFQNILLNNITMTDSLQNKENVSSYFYLNLANKTQVDCISVCLHSYVLVA